MKLGNSGGIIDIQQVLSKKIKNGTKFNYKLFNYSLILWLYYKKLQKILFSWSFFFL